MDAFWIYSREVTLQIKQGIDQQNKSMIALAMFLVQREREMGIGV
jgi:hypothetical protein